MSPPPKHSSKIYCESAYYRPVSGGEVEERVKGGNVVVGTGGFGFGEDKYGGPGEGSDGGGGGYRQDGDCNGLLVKWGGYCSNYNLRERA